MKKIIYSLFYLGLLGLPLTGQTEIILTEDGIEAAEIRIKINASLDGYAIVKRCAKCPDIKLKIDRNTQASSQGKVIHINRLNNLNMNFANIVFDPKTKRVKRITW